MKRYLFREACRNALELVIQPHKAVNGMLVAGMHLYISDLAVPDPVACTGRENEFLIADLAVPGVLLYDSSVIECAEMHVVNADARLKQRPEESHNRIDAFHLARKWVMTRHRPGHVGVKQLLADRVHVALVEALIHLEDQMPIIWVLFHRLVMRIVRLVGALCQVGFLRRMSRRLSHNYFLRLLNHSPGRP